MFYYYTKEHVLARMRLCRLVLRLLSNMAFSYLDI